MTKKNQYEAEPLPNANQEQNPVEQQEQQPATTPSEQTAEIKPAPEVQVAQTQQPAPVVATPVSNPPKATSATVRVAQKAPAKVNRQVQTFEFQVDQYLKLCENQIITEDMLKKKLYQFANIIRMIINSNDTAVFDAAYKFFKEYRNSILCEECVFGYIHTIPTEQSIRMQTIYTTFRELVEANVSGAAFKLDYGLIRDNLKLPAQHPLLNWIRNRLNR